MKKNLKIVSLLLALALLSSMLIACSATDTAASSAAAGAAATSSTAGSASASTTASAAASQGAAGETKPFKIGIMWSQALNDPTYTSALNNVKSAVEGAGGQLVIEYSSDMSAQGEITAIQKILNNDSVNGVIFTPMAESVIPVIQKMCEDAGVYFSMNNRMVTDPDIKAGLMASKYFAGCTFENEEETAKNAVAEMAQTGVKNLCVISGPVGDTASDARDKGIDEAVQQTGIKVLSKVRDLQTAADVTKAVEGFTAAFPDMDGIFVSYTWAQGALPALEKALETKGIAGKIKVGRIDFDNTMQDYFQKGQLNLVYGGQMQIDPYISTSLLVNAVMGTPISDKPIFAQVSYMKLASAEQAANYSKYLEGKVPAFTADEEKKMLLKSNNKDLNEQSITDIIKNFSLDDVMARHKDLANQ
jgi:DNA-binding LacI/PurR family transcriptional regulator